MSVIQGFDLFWIDLCRVRDMDLMSFLDTMISPIDTFPAKVSWYCEYKLSPTENPLCWFPHLFPG